MQSLDSFLPKESVGSIKKWLTDYNCQLSIKKSRATKLGDYRFYKEDMIHPNLLAINYIWEKFYENWLSDEALELKKEVIKIQKSLEHKPFNPNTDGHREFLASLQEKIELLKKKYPHISF